MSAGFQAATPPQLRIFHAEKLKTSETSRIDEEKFRNAALGIPADQFGEIGSVKALRSAVMSPWMALSRGGNPDYSAAFAAVLKQVIRSSVAVAAQSQEMSDVTSQRSDIE